MRSKEQLIAYIQNHIPNQVGEAIGGQIIIDGRIPNWLLQELRNEGKLERLYEDDGFSLSRNEWRKHPKI